MLWITSVIAPRVVKYLAVVGATLGAVFAIWAKGRSDGSAAARMRAAQDEINAAKERADADSRVGRESDPIGRLHEDWSRK
jgi:hypothetical protein